MPQPGERKTINGVTGEFDGQTWRQVTDSAPQAPSDGPVSRFVGGAMSTSPLNPMNLVRAVGNLPGTIGHIVADPLAELVDAGRHARNAVTNPGNEGWRGRVTEGVQAVEHLGGAVPLIGKSGIHAGERIGNGDVAGGAGELAGLASSAFVPDVIEGAPNAVRKVGSAMERGGTALGAGHGPFNLSPTSVLGGAEALVGHNNLAGASIAASPYILKYGGKGLQSLGNAMDAIRGHVSALPGRFGVDEPPPETPPTTVSGLSLSKDAIGRNIDATNMLDEGYSRKVAGRLSDIPGAGESAEVPYRANFPEGEPGVDTPSVGERRAAQVYKDAAGPNSQGGPALGGIQDAMPSAADDLLTKYLDSLKGGPGSGEQTFDMDGQHYVPDAIGSHVASPAESPDIMAGVEYPSVGDAAPARPAPMGDSPMNNATLLNALSALKRMK